MQTSYLPAERDNFLRGQMLAFNARVPRMTLKNSLLIRKETTKSVEKIPLIFWLGKKKQISSKGF